MRIVSGRTSADNHQGYHFQRALTAAVAYYTEGRTMEAIARDLNVSRSSVSRLLAYARETGIVEIRVAQPAARTGAIADRISSLYDVEARIVAVPDGTSQEDRYDRTAIYGASYLRDAMGPDTVLALAWGTMVNTMSYHLKPKAVTNCTLVQANGMGHGNGIGVHYAHAMMNRYGDAFRASVRQFPAPIFFDTAHLKHLSLAERFFADVHQLLERADIMLFSIGTVSTGVPSTPHLYGSYLTDEEFTQLAEDRAVGDIATTFFDPEGNHKTIRLNERSTGPDLDKIRSISRRICVASGNHKIHALHAALRGGHISELIVDEVTATAMLKAFAAEDSRQTVCSEQ